MYKIQATVICDWCKAEGNAQLTIENYGTLIQEKTLPANWRIFKRTIRHNGNDPNLILLTNINKVFCQYECEQSFKTELNLKSLLR